MRNQLSVGLGARVSAGIGLASDAELGPGDEVAGGVDVVLEPSDMRAVDAART